MEPRLDRIEKGIEKLIKGIVALTNCKNFRAKEFS
jgi:hypothetical protein